MALRIWHQSFTVLSDLPGYIEVLRARIKQVVSDDVEVVMHGQLDGTYPTDYPGTDIQYSALYWMHGIQWLAAAREAQRQKFDAMVLASLAAPMVREIRTLVDIPVVGYGEAVFNLAGLYGRKAGMLFFNTERLDFWPERLREWGVSERFAGIEHAGVSFKEVVGAHLDSSKQDEVVARIVAQGEKLAKEKGADVIIPGEMPMNLLLVKAGVHKIGGATVMDGLATSFQMAEMLCKLKNMAGMMPSHRGWFHDVPDPKRVAEVFKFYNLGGIASGFTPYEV